MAQWCVEEAASRSAHSPLPDPPPLLQHSDCVVVDGAPLQTLPENLYIPPQALRVFLESFEGPLDLLLHLVRRRNLDILRINLLELAEQYISYIDLMDEMEVDLAAEYLVMAATLTEIKLRMLLPQPVTEAEVEDVDPATAFMLRLRAYEQLRASAQSLEQLPQLGRDFQVARIAAPPPPRRLAPPPVPLELAQAMGALLRRVDWHRRHRMLGSQLSVRERMGNLLACLSGRRFVALSRLLVPSERRRGVVVHFLALLELLRERSIEVVQMQAFGPIYLRGGAGGGDAGGAEGSDGRRAA